MKDWDKKNDKYLNAQGSSMEVSANNSSIEMQQAAQIAQLQKELEEAKKKTISLENENFDLVMKSHNTNTQMQNKEKESQKTINELSQKIAQQNTLIEKDKMALSEENSKLIETNTILKNQVEGLKAGYTTLRNNYIDLQKASKNEFARLSGTIAQLQSMGTFHPQVSNNTPVLTPFLNGLRNILQISPSTATEIFHKWNATASNRNQKILIANFEVGKAESIDKFIGLFSSQQYSEKFLKEVLDALSITVK